MIKLFVLLGLLLSLSGCSEMLSLIITATPTDNRNLASHAAQKDYIYHKIVHNWRRTSENAKFPLPFTATVVLIYTPDGQLRFTHFETLSGSSQFDQELEAMKEQNVSHQ